MDEITMIRYIYIVVYMVGEYIHQCKVRTAEQQMPVRGFTRGFVLLLICLLTNITDVQVS